MSLTMNIDIEIRNHDALQAAADRMGLRLQMEYYRGRNLLCLYPKNLTYGAMVIDLERGSASVDAGFWSAEKINEVKAYYGIEKAKIDARLEGHSVYETWNEETQELELEIQIGGGE